MQAGSHPLHTQAPWHLASLAVLHSPSLSEFLFGKNGLVSRANGGSPNRLSNSSAATTCVCKDKVEWHPALLQARRGAERPGHPPHGSPGGDGQADLQPHANWGVRVRSIALRIARLGSALLRRPALSIEPVTVLLLLLLLPRP